MALCSVPAAARGSSSSGPSPSAAAGGPSAPGVGAAAFATVATHGNQSSANSITVVLDTLIDTGQDFGFTGCAAPNACGPFALDHDDDPALPSVVSGASLAVGTYTVTGASVPGWTVTAISCDSGGTVDLPARKVTIQLGAEDDVTCTFSVRTRSITIVQDTVPDLAQDFSFTGCLGEGCATFALDDDANPALPRSVTGEGLAPGTYTITQTSVGAGWPLANLSCDAPQTVDLANRRVTITLSALQSVTCTFTVRTTSITIAQDSSPDSAQDFTFTGCLGLGCSTFSLDDDADPTSPGSVTGEGLAPGTYTITQEHAPGWGVGTVACGAGATFHSVGPQLTVVLSPGQQVFCVFRNSPSPQNDAFAAAIELAQTGPQQGLVGSNDNATKEPGEPNHAGSPGGRSVWYRFVPATTHQVSFDTCFDGRFESTLGVYTGSSVASLTPVTASNDFCYDMGSGAPPTVGMRRSFQAVAGTTYWIAVDGRTGYGALSGTFRLSWGPDVGWP